jgi:hypothetical protein
MPRSGTIVLPLASVGGTLKDSGRPFTSTCIAAIPEVMVSSNAASNIPALLKRRIMDLFLLLPLLFVLAFRQTAA